MIFQRELVGLNNERIGVSNHKDDGFILAGMRYTLFKG